MNRAYHKWFSNALQKDMELLAFGDRGTRVIFFPTRKARFYDYENWGIIDTLKPKIESGQLHVYCVDSVDAESFYSHSISPEERISRHLQYEKYILDEVLPFSKQQNRTTFPMVAGCSLGAYHAVNIAFRHPKIFSKVVGMSGRYDLTKTIGTFRDLFDGYMDGEIFANMPNLYVPQLGKKEINALRKLKITIAIGQEDSFLDDNRLLIHSLSMKGIPHEFYIWDGEAHNQEQWKQMLQLYL